MCLQSGCAERWGVSSSKSTGEKAYTVLNNGTWLIEVKSIVFSIPPARSQPQGGPFSPHAKSSRSGLMNALNYPTTTRAPHHRERSALGQAEGGTQTRLFWPGDSFHCTSPLRKVRERSASVRHHLETRQFGGGRVCVSENGE